MAPARTTLLALLLTPTLAWAQATQPTPAQPQPSTVAGPPVTVLAEPPPPDWVPPDPASWWTDEWPKPSEAAEPLGPRRLGRGEQLTAIDNGVGPDLYRLWGLQPLQTRIIRGDEMIVEVWVRPARTVRQSVIRLYVRRDGESFVQARAGLACCEAGIARRVGFDAQLAPGWTGRIRALRDLPAWNSPRDVVVEEEGVSDAVCVDGVAYDVTLMLPGRARHLRRACDPAAIGEIADVLEVAVGAALGHEPRIDAVFNRGADYASQRQAYQALVAGGGRLKPAGVVREQPPAFEPPPEPEPATPPAAPSPPTAQSPPPAPSGDDGPSPGP
ncbi:MAG TPA: hypothetical protein VEA79_09265 [Phenylobacterium sp.]|nr:hypothetical protein [Phenylobacterium sp.]